MEWTATSKVHCPSQGHWSHSCSVLRIKELTGRPIIFIPYHDQGSAYSCSKCLSDLMLPPQSQVSSIQRAHHILTFSSVVQCYLITLPQTCACAHLGTIVMCDLTWKKGVCRCDKVKGVTSSGEVAWHYSHGPIEITKTFRGWSASHKSRGENGGRGWNNEKMDKGPWGEADTF